MEGCWGGEWGEECEWEGGGGIWVRSGGVVRWEVYHVELSWAGFSGRVLERMLWGFAG